MRKYRLVAKKGEGTFSEVIKAQNVKDGKYHAIKCMKNHFDSIDQVNNLREIQALRRLSPNQHVITLEEVLYDQPTGRLALVFELMDANLYELIRGRRHYLNASLIRSYMFQLARALHHMHRKGIFHRDIKPENILIENRPQVGQGLKLADFGSCRGIYSKQPYTEYISTRWYRAPECLMTDGYYGPEMDLWGAGCVFFEISSLYPLFPGTNELDQINRIHKVLGTPSKELLMKFKQKGAAHVNFDFPEQQGVGLPRLIPHVSADCLDLITRQLAYDAEERITARETLQHKYFKELMEMEVRRQTHNNSARRTTEDTGTGFAAKGLPTIPNSNSTNATVASSTASANQGVNASTNHQPSKTKGNALKSSDRHKHYIQNEPNASMPTYSKSVEEDDMLPPITNGASSGFGNSSSTKKKGTSGQAAKARKKNRVKGQSQFGISDSSHASTSQSNHQSHKPQRAARRAR